MITLSDNSYTDVAGNEGTGASSANYTVDTNGPTVSSITMSDTALKIGDTALVTITFSEAVNNFDNTDVTVEQGTLSTLSSADGGVTWTGTFTPTAAIEDTANLITVANTYTDLSGNAGTGATGPNYSVDTLAPTASISISDTALVSGETATVTITFSEAVTGLTVSDFTVDSGALSNLTTADGGITWTAIFTPAANINDASNVITLSDNSYTDVAGNEGTGASSANYTVYTGVNIAPIATDDPASTLLTAGRPASIDFTWSQPFISSISASGGTLKTNNADGIVGAIGVVGPGSTAELDDEIQNGESILVTLNAPVLSASFGFAKLDFTGVPETGLWIAYLDGVEVGRGQFNPTDTTRAGTVEVKDTSGNSIAFNQIKFDTATANSDYVVSWLTVGRNTATVQEGMSVAIPAGSGVLANDSDSDGGTLAVAAVRTGAEAGVGTDGTLGVALQGVYGKLTLNADGSYSYAADNVAALHPGQIAKDYFTYTLSDGQGGTDKATLTITVFGAMGSDNQFYGTAGNDALSGTSGADFISAAAGNDTMSGGLGADTFKWALADKGSAGTPATDVIQDFSTGQGDVLHLSELLQGENSSNLTNYLHFTYDAGLNQTTVHVSSAGNYSGGYNAGETDQVIVLNSHSVTGTNQEIINLLKASGNLITD